VFADGYSFCAMVTQPERRFPRLLHSSRSLMPVFSSKRALGNSVSITVYTNSGLSSESPRENNIESKGERFIERRGVD